MIIVYWSSRNNLLFPIARRRASGTVVSVYIQAAWFTFTFPQFSTLSISLRFPQIEDLHDLWRFEYLIYSVWLTTCYNRRNTTTMIISHLCATRQDIRGSTRALYSDNSRFCLPGKDDNRHILRLRIRIEMSAWVVERKDAGRFAEEYTALYAQIRREKSPNVGREPVFLSGVPPSASIRRELVFVDEFFRSRGWLGAFPFCKTRHGCSVAPAIFSDGRGNPEVCRGTLYSADFRVGWHPALRSGDTWRQSGGDSWTLRRGRGTRAHHTCIFAKTPEFIMNSAAERDCVTKSIQHAIRHRRRKNFTLSMSADNIAKWSSWLKRRQSVVSMVITRKA